MALAFMNGPSAYVQKMTEKKNMIASGVLLGSIVMALYFSVIEGSYLWSLLFCIIEVIHYSMLSFIVKRCDPFLL
jgi:hypothetical protein